MGRSEGSAVVEAREIQDFPIGAHLAMSAGSVASSLYLGRLLLILWLELVY
jgi:hypothetical protein